MKSPTTENVVYTEQYIKEFAKALSTPQISWQMYHVSPKDRPLVSKKKWTCGQALAIKNQFAATFGDFIEIVQENNEGFHKKGLFIKPKDKKGIKKNKKLLIAQENVLPLLDKIRQDCYTYIESTVRAKDPTVKVMVLDNVANVSVVPTAPQKFIWVRPRQIQAVARPYLPSNIDKDETGPYRLRRAPCEAEAPGIAMEYHSAQHPIPKAWIDKEKIQMQDKNGLLTFKFKTIKDLITFHQQFIQAPLLRQEMLNTATVMEQLFRERYDGIFPIQMRTELLSWVAGPQALYSTPLEVENNLAEVPNRVNKIKSKN